MAGTVKTNIVQLGDSATATQNLVIRTNVDGTFTIARGNSGATIQDILTIDAAGKILMPQSKGPAFIAYATSGQSIPSATFTKLLFDTEENDTNGCLASSRFTPTTAGFYQINGAVQFNSGTSPIVAIFKNDAEYARGVFPQGTSSQSSTVAALVFLNGTTDYVELKAYQQSGSAMTTQASIRSLNYFHGFLAREA
jgi:hypothetical protein